LISRNIWPSLVRRATLVINAECGIVSKYFDRSASQNLGASLVDGAGDLANRVESAPLRAVPVGRLVEVRLEDRFQDQDRGYLHHPVADGRNAEWSLAHAARLRNPHPSERLWSIASGACLLT